MQWTKLNRTSGRGENLTACLYDVTTTNLVMAQNCGVDTSVGEYLKEFHWGLTEVVYEWARQMVSLSGTDSALFYVLYTYI